MGLLDNAITVEEFQKRKKESLAKSRFKETGSVMSRPISEEWQPDNVRHGGHALEAPMFSPDDLIGSGIFSKLGLLATSAAPALASGLLGVVAKNKGVSTMPSKIARALDKQAGAIAWHGSPHKFDKFDMSKIGTGEGAQAYGHGLYMAESPDVGKEYARVLTKNAFFDGKPIYEIDTNTLGRRSTILSEVQNMGKDARGSIPGRYTPQGLDSEYDGPIAAMKALVQSGKIPKNATKWIDENGSINVSSVEPQLYKVDIPDEAVAKFLDWDKPLSQQAPEVRAAIGKMRDQFPISKNGWDIKPWMDADPLASTWHNEAVRELGLGQDYFTKHLSESGVPGIRYLDGGSRSAGQGSSNFVLFDDQLPRILERNGQPTGLQPWAKGEWKGLLDEPAPKLTEFEQRHLTAQKNAALPVEQGGLGLPPNNTAMDRARAMGAEFGWAHGSPSPNITELRSSKIGAEGPGAYATNYLPEANIYAQSKNGSVADGATVYPLAILKDKSFNAGKSNPYELLKANDDSELAQRLSAIGKDGIERVQDATPQWLIDAGGLAMPERSHYVSQNAANFRSPFAAFDPKRRHEADLLGYADPYLLGAMGAGGLLGMGGYSMMNDK